MGDRRSRLMAQGTQAHGLIKIVTTQGHPIFELAEFDVTRLDRFEWVFAEGVGCFSAGKQLSILSYCHIEPGGGWQEFKIWLQSIIS